jgi:uncharacterized protein (UPF0303 family)
MDIATLEDQARRLVLPHFGEDDALALGQALVAMARAENLPIVINIRTANRTLFHAAMPGSGPNNDNWARRKSNTALMMGAASLLVGARNRAKGETLAGHGFDSTDYADHGGAVPVRVEGVGVVAVVTVSGLPQIEDHALAVRALAAMVAG